MLFVVIALANSTDFCLAGEEVYALMSSKGYGFIIPSNGFNKNIWPKVIEHQLHARPCSLAAFNPVEALTHKPMLVDAYLQRSWVFWGKGVGSMRVYHWRRPTSSKVSARVLWGSEGKSTGLREDYPVALFFLLNNTHTSGCFSSQSECTFPCFTLCFVRFLMCWWFTKRSLGLTNLSNRKWKEGSHFL